MQARIWYLATRERDCRRHGQGSAQADGVASDAHPKAHGRHQGRRVRLVLDVPLEDTSNAKYVNDIFLQLNGLFKGTGDAHCGRHFEARLVRVGEVDCHGNNEGADDLWGRREASGRCEADGGQADRRGGSRGGAEAPVERDRRGCGQDGQAGDFPGKQADFVCQQVGHG